MANEEKTFGARIKCGYSSDDIDMASLPKEFAVAKELWATKTEENVEKATEMIAPYVTCFFAGRDFSSLGDGDLSELFESDMNELEATDIVVSGVDFTDSNLPKLDALALFENVITKGELDDERLEAWQLHNGFLYTCVDFQWRLDGVVEHMDSNSELSFRLYW